MDKAIQKQDRAPSSERRSFNTQFFSPNSTGYSGSASQMNWMKQKFTLTSERMQDIESQSMLETPKESSRTQQLQSSRITQTLLSKTLGNKKDNQSQKQQGPPSRPLTREEEYKLYPALKYRDYASSNSYIKFTNYRPSLASNLNKGKNPQDYSPPITPSNYDDDYEDLTFPSYTHEQLRQKNKQKRMNKIQSGGSIAFSQMPSSYSTTATGFYQNQNPNVESIKITIQKNNNFHRSNSSGGDLFNVTRPYFLSSRGQLNSQQKEFQSDQISFIPDPNTSNRGQNPSQNQKRKQQAPPTSQNSSSKQKYFISRTRFRKTDDKTQGGADKTNVTQNTNSSNLIQNKQVRSSTINGNKYPSSQREEILSDVDIRLMMIAAGIDPLLNYITRRANFGCKSIYNPDQLSHFERINSKNYFLTQLDPFEVKNKKFQTTKDVAEYYHHLERYDKEGRDEYFIETREKATNYNRFHMSKPNIRMRYEQQLRIANLLISQAKQEKNNKQSRSNSPNKPIGEQQSTQGAENSMVHGLHRYLLAKDLIKETWKQLSQPETPNPTQIIKILNTNTQQSKQSFTTLLREKGFHRNDIVTIPSQPESMKNISSDEESITQYNNQDQVELDKEIDKSQFKFQQFVIDEGLQEMNHYDDIVRQYKQKFLELNKQGRENNQKPGSPERVTPTPSPPKSQDVLKTLPDHNQVELKHVNINQQLQNFPTELNIYTREDIFIKRTIDRMINNDEIDIVTYADIAQLQRIIEQRKNILSDLKEVIIKSINEILHAKKKNRQLKQQSTLESLQHDAKSLQQDAKSLQAIGNNTQKQKIRNSFSSQKTSNGPTLTRISKTQQMERKKKLKKQNSLGYKDYVKTKAQQEIFDRIQNKNSKPKNQTLKIAQPSISVQVQKNKLYTSSVISNEEPYDATLSDEQDYKKDRIRESDLQQLKTDVVESQGSQSPSNAQRWTLNSQDFKNINEILDPYSADSYYKMNYEEGQNIDLKNKVQQQISQGTDIVIDEDENEQYIDSESKLELKQNQTTQKSNLSQSNLQIGTLQSFTNIDNFQLEIQGKHLSVQSPSQNQSGLPSFNIFKQEQQSANKIQDNSTNVLLAPTKQKSRPSKPKIQTLGELKEENDSPQNQKGEGINNQETSEMQENDHENDLIFKSSQNYFDQIPTLSKFNPLHSQRDSINLPPPVTLNQEMSSIQQMPSIMIADSLINLKQPSLVESTIRISQVDKDFSEFSSLSQIDSKKLSEIKMSQQNLMNALKQADIVQKQKPTIPSLLELPNKSKGYITYSLINEQSPQPSPLKPSLTSRSNLDSPQLSPQPDSQRSVLSKSEYEKEKLSSLMTHQKRLNKQTILKSNVRMHSDVTKNANISEQKALIATQFNSMQEFNHVETQSINARNIKITEFFEKADKVIATKATLNKPEGYNPFLNEEEAEQMIEKMNKSRNSNASIDNIPQIQLHHVKDTVNTQEDEQQESLSNILGGKLSAREDRFDSSMQIDDIEEAENEEDEHEHQHQINQQLIPGFNSDSNSDPNLQKQQIRSSESEDQKKSVKIIEPKGDLEQEKNEQPQNTKHQVRFELEDEGEDESEKEDIRQKKKSEIELTLGQEQSMGLENESSAVFSDSRQLSFSAISRQVSTTNIKDDPKKKRIDSKTKLKKKANIVKSITNAFDTKKSDSSTLKQSSSIMTHLENPQQQISSRQPSLAYLDDNIMKSVSQHNIADIQKLVSDKFKNKKSMVQGFSGASLYKIMTESFVELEEQANTLKEDGSNIFQTKKSLSNVKSNQKLIKTKSFKNLSTKNVFKQNAINDILNEYKINDKMNLTEKRRIIEKLVNKLEAKADIEEDQNFNSLLYKQVQTELKYISLNENDTNQQILQQKPTGLEEVQFFDSMIDTKKKDWLRGRLKFSDNIVLNQKNNILEEVNEEDLDMDHDLMDMIQKLVKQNEDLDEENERRKIFKLQTQFIQKAMQKKQGYAPIIDQFKQLPLQQELIDKGKKKRKYHDNVHTFKRQPTKFYGSSGKLSKEEIEMLKKMKIMQEKFKNALITMSKEEKMNLKEQYLHIKQRAESR